MEPTISTEAVAAYLGVDRRTVINYIKRGKLKAYRFGNRYLIPETAVAEFLENSKLNYEEIEKQ